MNRAQNLSLFFGILISLLFLRAPFYTAPQIKIIPSDVISKTFGGDFILPLPKGGGQFSTRAYRGKFLLLFFGFTQCPDICPMALSKISSLYKKLPEELSKKITPVFISVDHKRDNSVDVMEYAQYYHPRFIGLTGGENAINDITKRYGAFYKYVDMPDSAMGQTIDHSSRLYLIGKDGKVAKIFSDKQPNQELVQALVKHMNK